MKSVFSSILALAVISGLSGLGSGCARRMTVATGTTIGLHATPGDGQSQPPQVTLAYKRAELAVVPTAGKTASKCPDSDAFSAMAIIDFQTKFFGKTSIDQFVATGHASREIQTAGSEFTRALAGGGGVRDAIVEANIYKALQAAAAAGDGDAAACVRELDALGELEPDEYTYLETSPTAPPAALRKFTRRNSSPNYDSFKTYRARLGSSVNNLKSGPTVNVTEPDGAKHDLSGNELARELNKYERTLADLRQRASSRGATRRALAHYPKTLER